MTALLARRVVGLSLASVVLSASVLVVGISGGTSVEALTTSVWVSRGPSNHRTVGTAVSATGQIGYTASTHINGIGGAGRVLQSTDSLTTWTIVDGVPAGSWNAVATSADGQSIVVTGQGSAGDHSVFVSTDGGTTWVDRAPAAVFAGAAITADGSTIVIASSTGVLLSSDAGATWTAVPGFDPSPHSVGVGLDAGVLVVHAAYVGRVMSWRDDGSSAAPTLTTPGGAITDLDVSDDGEVVIVATRSSYGAEISLDGGATWTRHTQDGMTNSLILVAVSGDGTHFAVSSYGQDLRESDDAGATWTAVPNILAPPWHALSLSVDGSSLLAGLENRPLHMRIPTPAPSVTSVDIDEVATTGGATVRVTGAFFHDVTSVTLGGVEAPSFDVVAPVEMTIVTPPGGPGPADLVVTTAHGRGILADAVEYYAAAAPVISGQSIAAGSFLGGQVVTLDGTGLAEVTTVRVGDRVASVLWASRTQLMVRTPPNRVGLMDIVVESPLGRHVLSDGWTSTWESRRSAPRWSAIDERDGFALELVDDGDGGLFIGGYFFDTAATHWDGHSTVNPVSNGVVVGSANSEPFFAYGVQAIMPTSDGSVWLGGSLTTVVGQSPMESPPVKVAPSGEPTPAPALDGMVLALAPGTSATTLVAGGLFTGTVAELDIGAGTWTVLGDDGNGGSAFGPGTYRSDPLGVTALARRPGGGLLAGGSFTLSNSLNQFGDLVAEWDGTSWRPVVPALQGEMATAFDVGTIDGEEVVAISTGAVRVSGSGEISVAGRVLLLHADDTVETIGVFSSLVRDVVIVHDTVVAVGYFSAALGAGEARQANYAGVLVDGDWIDLGVAAGAIYGLDTVEVLGDDRVVVGGLHQRIDGTTDLAGLAVSTPITALVSDVTQLTVTAVEASVADDDGVVSVTVTGTGFDDDTDATIDGRPVGGLEIVSSTELRFTTTASAVERTVEVFGADNTATGRLSATPDRPEPDAPDPDASVPESTESTTTTIAEAPDQATQTTTAPATPLPSPDTIAGFPIRTLIPPGTVLSPGAPLTVTADGFVPGEQVSVLIASTPRLLGTATVGADGTATSTVSLPTDLLGGHTIIVWSPTTGRGVRQPIMIEGGLLPATGSTDHLISLTIGVVLVGVWLVLASRRRS